MVWVILDGWWKGEVRVILDLRVGSGKGRLEAILKRGQGGWFPYPKRKILNVISNIY